VLIPFLTSFINHLTDSHRLMEKDGIITRTLFTEVPPKVLYSLSPLGETMRPILDALQEWGNNYKEKYTKNNA